MNDFLKYGTLPMVMDQDNGDAGGGGGGTGDPAPSADPAPDPQGGGDDPNSDPSGGDNPSGDDPSGGSGDPDPADPNSDPAGGGDPKPSKDSDPADPAPSDDWRKEYAGDDEKKLAFLERIPSQKALIDKMFEQDKMIRSGKHREAPGEDASEEEVKAFREKNGIPTEADGYLDALPEGLVLGEDMKENMTPYLERMHNNNAPPELVAEGLQAFQEHQEAYAEKVAKDDVDAQNAAITQLKEDYGPDYDANMQALTNFVEANFPAEVHDSLKEGRLGDGTPIMSDARVMDAFIQMQRQLNPTGTITSGVGMDQLDTIEDRISDIEKNHLGTKSYYKDERLQSEYKNLLEARERYKTKK